MFLLSKKFVVSLILFFGILMPNASFAAGIVPCGSGDNPDNACTLCHLVIGTKNIISFGAELLITVTVVGIFIAGIMYILAAGNEQSMETAKSFLGASLKGFVIFLMAWFFVNVIIMWVLAAKTGLGIKKNNWYTFSCNTTSSSASLPTKNNSSQTGGANGK